jgi:SAM-dependent methyltransferase
MNALFNRPLHRKRREKAAAKFHEVDFLFQTACERLADRLLDMDRTFPLVAELGCHHGSLASHIPPQKIERLIQCDMAQGMVQQAPSNEKLVVDEEWLPFQKDSLNAILSVLSLQWVNDIPGCLIQCRDVLKPDGLLLAVVPGPRTLQELRSCMIKASGSHGAAPRISPFVEVRDAGSLLQRAGFALPVIDNEILTVTYAEPMKLLRELQAMGEANALHEQHKGPPPRHFWPTVLQHYVADHAREDGRIPVTVEFVYITAWKADASQQQPAKRGSGQINLTELFGSP